MAHKILIAGQWRPSSSNETFRADNPKLAEPIADEFPISNWDDIDAALDAAVTAFQQLKKVSGDQIAAFLNLYADRLEARSGDICERASMETALPVEPRLASGEMPRTVGQIRQAAAAAQKSSWCQPIIDTTSNIRSCLAPIGPIAVFGPNNFPLAFGSVSGSDFASAIAAGNPVIGKAHSMHPETTRLMAVEAVAAAQETGMPEGIVQMIYRMSHQDGERMAKDPRLASIGFTGGQSAGLKLKSAADSVGKPVYLELSSINPVVVLPGAIKERADEIATEFSSSCLMGAGQFCTNPGLVVLIDSPETQGFIDSVVARFTEAPVGTLLSRSGQNGLSAAVQTLVSAGAELLCGGSEGEGAGCSYSNTLLRTSGDHFLANAGPMQTEAFGSASLVVVVSSEDQAIHVLDALEGNLTGTIYSDTQGSDDQSYDKVAPSLRQKVGRLINDKMPTGVAVSPAMNHGGPYPATGHAGFTAVGMPGAIQRFTMLQSFDNVRPHRLPSVLQNENSNGVWRSVDGQWTQAAVGDLATV